MHDSERTELLVTTSVGMIERLGDLEGEIDRDGDRKSTQGLATLEQGRDVHARHVLGRQKVRRLRCLLGPPEIEHLRQVRVGEPHREKRLG